MRNIVIEKIHSLMKKNDKIFFLTADMGINLVEIFKKDYPKRYLNVGIAEQNLINVSDVCWVTHILYELETGVYLFKCCFYFF